MPYKPTGRPPGCPPRPRPPKPLLPNGYWLAYRSEYMQSIIIAKGSVALGDIGAPPEGSRAGGYYPRDWRRKRGYVPSHSNLGPAEAAELWWGPGARDAVVELLNREAMMRSGPHAGVQCAWRRSPGRSATPRATGAAAAAAGAAADLKGAAG